MLCGVWYNSAMKDWIMRSFFVGWLVLLLFAGCRSDSGNDTPVDIPPKIEIAGANPMSVEVGTVFVDPGAKAIDNEDGELSVKVISEVDISKIGTYRVVYQAVDSAGNETNASRIVHVVDMTAPTIHLNGASEMEVVLGNDYIEMGAEAYDNVDGNLTVAIEGNVNETRIGSYEVKYTAVDSHRNKATKKRVVRIVSPEVLIGSLNVQEKACGNFQGIRIDGYTYKNNTWGRSQVPDDQDWVQCVFSYIDTNGTLRGGLYWGWPYGNGGVKGYPEVIYGRKFRSQYNPESGWPIQVSKMREVFVDIAYQDINFTGSYNIAPEWWLHLDENTSMKNIKYEIMVRLDPDGFHPHNAWMKDVVIDGIRYDLYKDEPSGVNKRQFFNFVAHEKIRNFKLHPNAFMNFLYEHNVSDIPDLYYADIEMGVEVIDGSGVVLIDRMKVMQANNPIASAKVNSLYSYNPELNDTTLTYTIANKPSWASFASTNGELSGTPDQAGLYRDIEINASNGVQHFQVAKFDLNVTDE